MLHVGTNPLGKITHTILTQYQEGYARYIAMIAKYKSTNAREDS